MAENVALANDSDEDQDNREKPEDIRAGFFAAVKNDDVDEAFRWSAIADDQKESELVWT